MEQCVMKITENNKNALLYELKNKYTIYLPIFQCETHIIIINVLFLNLHFYVCLQTLLLTGPHQEVKNNFTLPGAEKMKINHLSVLITV